MDGGKRLDWLDFGKAAGIFVVLFVHANCSPGVISFYGGRFYMPVFFVAAGYTYRCRENESRKTFLKKKAVRLLIPYFAVSTFLWVFFWLKDSVLSGNPLDLKLHSILGILYSRNQMYGAAYMGENPVLLDLLNAPLWFLTAMFLTYVWYDGISRSRRKYIYLAAGAAAVFFWHNGTELLLPWSLDAVPYFACFFAVGEWFRRGKREEALGELWCLGLLVVIFVISSRLNGDVNLSNGGYGYSMLLCFAAGVSGSLLAFEAGMWLERMCPPLMYLICLAGQETLTILCFHMFLFMFIQTGAGLLGFGGSLTRTLMVGGSILILTAAGKVWNRLGRHT